MHVTVNLPDGSKHKLEAPEGWRLMEVMRDYGLPVKAECGGSCACATCHVYVRADWVEKIPAPLIEEIEMLDEAFDVIDQSRLSCQIITNDALDGLEVTLVEDSLADAAKVA